MSFPAFYDPQKIGTLFYPDIATIAAEAAAANLPPAADDAKQRHLLLIDMQIDFCHPDGTLFVPGAVEDVQRTIELIFTHAAQISQISCSLDSHLPHQIFHPAWWADAEGNHPAPFTLITLADIENGRYRPLFKPEKSIAYVRQLEKTARKTLTIWPYHVMIGSIGNALDPMLFSAILWHSLARNISPNWLTKGSIPLTEHYSIIQPEVPMPEFPLGDKNQPFLDKLAKADSVIIAGEAESHCVLETVEDLVEEFSKRPETLKNLIMIKDAMSPVQHPDIDFHAIAQGRFAEFEKLGVQFISSDDPLP